MSLTYCLKFLLTALLLPWLLQPCAAQEELTLDPSLLQLAQSVGQQSAQTAQPFDVQWSQEGQSVTVSFTLEPGAYIYQDSIKVTAENALISLNQLPPAAAHQDIQGQQQVYFDGFAVKLTVERWSGTPALTISYQGCSSDGICFPPAQSSFTLDPALLPAQAQSVPVSASDAAAAPAQTELSADAQISRLLDQNFILGLLLCIGFGVLLDLTPCVLPMLPVFSAMLAGGSKLSKAQIVRQDLGYSAGLCLTYTVLGLLFALLGASLQGVLQHPALHAVIAALLVICALGCADIIKLQLPVRLTAGLQNQAARFTSGSFSSALILGVISALIASPCTSAPLAGALLYVLSSGDLVKGAAAFFCIGLGMALPLFIIGLFGSSLLKKAGRFSSIIKKVLASLLVIAAVYLCRQLLNTEIYYYILSTVVFGAVIYCGYEFILDHEHGVQMFPAVLLFGAAFFISEAVYMNYDPQRESADAPAGGFTRITSLSELKQYQQGIVLMDFTAAWCTNCQVMDQEVFSTQEFAALTADMTKLQFDITNVDDPKVQEMLKTFKIFGVPYVLVLKDGKPAGSAAGYQSLEQLQALLGQR